MAVVRHLGFVKMGNFNCPYPSVGQCASSCQISCRSAQTPQFRATGVIAGAIQHFAGTYGFGAATPENSAICTMSFVDADVT